MDKLIQQVLQFLHLGGTPSNNTSQNNGNKAVSAANQQLVNQNAPTQGYFKQQMPDTPSNRIMVTNYQKTHPNYNPQFISDGQNSPMQQAQTALDQPQNKSSNQPQDLQTIQNHLINGFTSLYGKNSPALQYIPDIMNAIQTNPFHRANPYLAASQMVEESSGASNITRPNNITNWGINVPAWKDPTTGQMVDNNQIFAKMNPHDVFNQYLTGIGGRDPNFKQYQTGQTLTPDQLNQLGSQYAPDDKTYGQRLESQIQAFQDAGSNQ